MKNHFTIKFPINVIVDGAIRLRTMSSVEMVQDDDGEWKFRASFEDGVDACGVSIEVDDQRLGHYLDLREPESFVNSLTSDQIHEILERFVRG